jgi:hypothetical protein
MSSPCPFVPDALTALTELMRRLTARQQGALVDDARNLVGVPPFGLRYLRSYPCVVTARRTCA